MAHIVSRIGPDRRPRSVVPLALSDVLAMTTAVRTLRPSERDLIATAAQAQWGFCGVGLRRDQGPPGSIAPGAVAPGAVAPGTVAPGTVAPGTVAPGTATDDAITSETRPSETEVNGTEVNGTVPADDWAAVILVAPCDGLPRGHPLAAGGLDNDIAGLALVYIAPTESTLILGKRLCGGLIRCLRGQVAGLEAQASRSTAVATPLAPPRSWLARMGFYPMRYPLDRYRFDFTRTVQWSERHPWWSPWTRVALSTPEVGLTRTPLTRVRPHTHATDQSPA